MDPYSGLIDMLEAKGILKKDGNRLAYTSNKTGEIFKEFRKNWTDEQLSTIMEEWDESNTNNLVLENSVDE